MNGLLTPMTVWYRGDADILPLLFADYDESDVS